MPSSRLALSALMIALAGVTSAEAQGDGVVVDPDTPAGTEYAIPLEKARREASGESGRSNSAGQALFGAGIEPVGGASGGGAGSTRSQRGQNREKSPGGADGFGTKAIARGAQRTAALEAAAANGDSTALRTAGIAAAVLCAALAAGFGLRSFLRSS